MYHVIELNMDNTVCSSYSIKCLLKIMNCVIYIYMYVLKVVGIW